jgi:hypothetical protein
MKAKAPEEFVHEMEVRLHMLNYDGQQKLINGELVKWYHAIRDESLREAARTVLANESMIVRGQDILADAILSLISR